MAVIGGPGAVLWEVIVSMVSGLYSGLGTWIGWVGSVLAGVLGSMSSWVGAAVGGLVGVIWGGILVVGLFVAAAVLNVLGVDNVYDVLDRTIDRGDTERTEGVTALGRISSEDVTDERGRFSAEAFENVTGMTPPEFVHLLVKTNGGRIRQQTLNTCLPWSNATVSHILDTLERDGAVERVRSGRENIVCTPESIPSGHSP